jgi:hypothetical protein
VLLCAAHRPAGPPAVTDSFPPCSDAHPPPPSAARGTLLAARRPLHPPVQASLHPSLSSQVAVVSTMAASASKGGPARSDGTCRSSRARCASKPQRGAGLLCTGGARGSSGARGALPLLCNPPLRQLRRLDLAGAGSGRSRGRGDAGALPGGEIRSEEDGPCPEDDGGAGRRRGAPCVREHDAWAAVQMRGPRRGDPAGCKGGREFESCTPNLIGGGGLPGSLPPGGRSLPPLLASSARAPPPVDE